MCGDREQLMMLLDRINSPFVRANAPVLQALMRLIPFLAFGDRDKMLTLINHFKPYINFNRSVYHVAANFFPFTLIIGEQIKIEILISLNILCLNVG